MFYQIRVNEKDIGIYGHEYVINFHAGISSGREPDGAEFAFIKPSLVCEENGTRSLLEWAFCDIGLSDKIEVIPTSNKNISEPEVKRRMS